MSGAVIESLSPCDGGLFIGHHCRCDALCFSPRPRIHTGSKRGRGEGGERRYAKLTNARQLRHWIDVGGTAGSLPPSWGDRQCPFST